MDEFWTSPTYGSDSNAGTKAAPYATFKKALDQTATTPNSTKINLGNSAAETITTELVFINGAGNKWSYDRELIVAPWDEGDNGTLYRTINGVAAPVWKIILGGTAESIWAVNEYPDYSRWFNGIVDATANGGPTSYGVFQTQGSSLVDGIEVINATGSSGIKGTSGDVFRNCRVYTTNGTSYPTKGMELAGTATASHCYVNGSLNNAITAADIESCIMRNFGRGSSTYFAVSATGGSVFNNNVIIGGDHANSVRGVYVNSFGLRQCYNNIFMNLNEGVWVHTVYDNSCYEGGANVWFNVTDKWDKFDSPYGLDYDLVIDYSEFDLDLDASPFVDEANDDYTLPANSPLLGRGIVPWPSRNGNFGGALKHGGGSVMGPPLRCDIGPIQSGNAGLPFAGVRS